jgi:hypothetical protein
MKEAGMDQDGKDCGLEMDVLVKHLKIELLLVLCI